MKVADLRTELKNRQLNTKGTKQVLISRLAPLVTSSADARLSSSIPADTQGTIVNGGSEPGMSEDESLTPSPLALVEKSITDIQSQLASYVRSFNAQILSIRDDVFRLKGLIDSTLHDKIVATQDELNVLQQMLDMPPTRAFGPRPKPGGVRDYRHSHPQRPSQRAPRSALSTDDWGVASDSLPDPRFCVLSLKPSDASNSPAVISHLIRGLYTNRDLPIPDFKVFMTLFMSIFRSRFLEPF